MTAFDRIIRSTGAFVRSRPEVVAGAFGDGYARPASDVAADQAGMIDRLCESHGRFVGGARDVVVARSTLRAELAPQSMVGFRRCTIRWWRDSISCAIEVLGIERERSGRSRIAATAVLARLHRPSRASVELGLKARVAAALAIWLGERIHLRNSDWAGFSVVVATAGRSARRLRQAISRISATVVGLAVGLASFALPVSGTLVEGATLSVALIVLPALSLDTVLGSGRRRRSSSLRFRPRMPSATHSLTGEGARERHCSCVPGRPETSAFTRPLAAGRRRS